MENASYIQWNLPNWITVFLMAIVGVAVFGALASTAKTFLASR